jgi:prevent-host-death family protein
MERQIGATDLRQRLTDVLQQVREERAIYIVETFGRPQAALVNIDEYRRFQQFQEERGKFFKWLEETASANAAYNKVLSEDELLVLIEQARIEAANSK